MQSLRTPDERFVDLPDFPFAPHYVEIDDGDGGRLRVHYLDEGPADAPPVLLMHGEPSWCFLYRTMIPVLTAAGHRVIAPDLVGFGRSDKPAGPHRLHVPAPRRLDAARAHRRASTSTTRPSSARTGAASSACGWSAEHPDRFSRVVAANTMLPTGDHDPGEAFLAWQKYSQETPNFHVGGIVNGGTTSEMAPEVIAAYDAPFPDETYKEGARQFPLLVPTSPDDPAAGPNRAAWDALASGRSRSSPRSPTRTRSPAAVSACSRAGAGRGRSDAPDDRRRRSLPPGRRGPELARIVAEFIATT